MTTAPVTRAAAPVQNVQPAPQSQPRQCLSQVKQKAAWAWDTTVENVKTAAGAIKGFIQRIINAVCNFFTCCLDSISRKLGARYYDAQINTITTQLQQRTQERDNALQTNGNLTQENNQLREANQGITLVRNALVAQLAALQQPAQPQPQAAQPAVVQVVPQQPQADQPAAAQAVDPVLVQPQVAVQIQQQPQDAQGAVQVQVQPQPAAVQPPPQNGLFNLFGFGGGARTM